MTIESLRMQANAFRQIARVKEIDLGDRYIIVFTFHRTAVKTCVLKFQRIDLDTFICLGVF